MPRVRSNKDTLCGHSIWPQILWAGQINQQKLAGAAILLFTFAFLSTADRASAQIASYWEHNGSVVSLVADGSTRKFFYAQPRPSLTALGVQSGTLLFDGRKDGDTYSGTAYIFSRDCAPSAYPVSGTVSADSRQVVMYGKAPRRNATCEVIGFRDDKLVFNFQQPNSNQSVEAPPPTSAFQPTFVCDNADAIRQVIGLLNLETGDEISGSPSPASPQRQAIMAQLRSQYCRRNDQPVSFDRQEKLDALCTFYSGPLNGSRVYWARCLTCTEAGIQCE